MDRIFEIDFKKVLVYFLPKFFRRKRIFAIMEVMLSQIRNLYISFMGFREGNIEDMNTTPQVFSLRKILNDRFDDGSRMIRIVDSSIYDRTYIYTQGENRPIYLGNRIIYTTEELNSNSGFTVIAPERLNNPSEISQMKAIINRYKLAGTKYYITYE